MLKVSLMIGAALALAACSASGDVEDSIRETLANQGTVDDVNMVEGSDGNMTGYAVVTEKDGTKGRLSCNAHREGSDKYAWKCLPVIDAAAEKQLAEKMKPELAKIGEVMDVEMHRKDDDNHLEGTAHVRTADGDEHGLICKAERQPDSQLAWSCQEAGVIHHASPEEAAEATVTE